MYMCIFKCICVYLYVYVYVCICVYVYMCIHIYIYTLSNIYMVSCQGFMNPDMFAFFLGLDVPKKQITGFEEIPTTGPWEDLQQLAMDMNTALFDAQ